MSIDLTGIGTSEMSGGRAVRECDYEVDISIQLMSISYSATGERQSFA